MLRFIGSICVVALCACSLGPHRLAYADGMTEDEYRAAYQIAGARCDRQTNACASFASRDACIRAKLVASAADTSLMRCSEPIDPSQLQSCVSEIERGQCGSGIARLKACRQSALCPYVSEEGTF